MPDSGTVQSAEFTVQVNPLQLRASVRVTPQGLLAIAALVSSILVSTGAIVWIAGVTHRKTHILG